MHGCLGTNSDSEHESIAFPQVIESFQEATDLGLLEVKQVACGENFSMSIVEMKQPDDSTERSVLVWGSNDKK